MLYLTQDFVLGIHAKDVNNCVMDNYTVSFSFQDTGIPTHSKIREFLHIPVCVNLTEENLAEN